MDRQCISTCKGFTCQLTNRCLQISGAWFLPHLQSAPCCIAVSAPIPLTVRRALAPFRPMPLHRPALSPIIGLSSICSPSFLCLVHGLLSGNPHQMLGKLFARSCGRFAADARGVGLAQPTSLRKANITNFLLLAHCALHRINHKLCQMLNICSFSPNYIFF